MGSYTNFKKVSACTCQCDNLKDLSLNLFCFGGFQGWIHTYFYYLDGMVGYSNRSLWNRICLNQYPFAPVGYSKRQSRFLSMQLILDVAMIVGIYSVAVQVSVLGQLDIWKNAWIQVQK